MKKTIARKEAVPSRISNSFPQNHGVLGKEIRIGIKTHVSISGPGRESKWFVPTVEVLIGIGKNHTAHLIMDTDAWEALKGGEKLSIDTLQQYEKMFIKPRKSKKK